MYSIIYEPQAENDLVDIVSYYTEQGGVMLGEDIFERIVQHINRLEIFPYRTTESQYVAEMRELYIEKLPYKALIFIDETLKQVHILRILHTSRKYP